MREYCYNEQVNADERLSIVDIGEDLDPDVFEDFLVFIYTGRLRTTENMAELWAAANKYDVKTLERIGESVKGRPKMEEMYLTLMFSLWFLFFVREIWFWKNLYEIFDRHFRVPSAEWCVKTFYFSAKNNKRVISLVRDV